MQGAFQLAKCQHPHIVKAEETFQEGGIWCVAMEYIDGIDLADRARAILPEEKALSSFKISSQVLCRLQDRRSSFKNGAIASILPRSRSFT